MSAALALAPLAPAGAQLAGQLGVLDLTANGGINPATGAAWIEGDTYRLVFVTSQATDATSSDITTYNAFVQEVADASIAFPKLGNGLWKIVASTTTVDARDNTGTNPGVETGVAVFLMDGATAIANDNADLWNGIAANLGLDENGDTLIEDRVFTGSNGNGTAVLSGNFPLGSASAIRTGRSDRTGTGWMVDFNVPPASLNSVFAMSAPLTVVDLADTTAPMLVSISDDQSGGPVAVPQAIVYTVTFDKPMSAGSVNASDFGNDPALDTVVTIDGVEPTSDPAVYEVKVTTTEAGSLRLQIMAGAELADLPGNALDTTTALPDDTTIAVSQDVTPPNLVSITDNVEGGPIVATRSMTPRYTVSFDEAIDPATVGADDFENGSSAPVTIDRVSTTGDPAAFEVTVTTSGPGELVLQIRQGAVIRDLAGNDLVTTSALPDDTTIAVSPPPDLAGQLGVLDVVNANGGINPATGLAWAAGDTYRLVFLTSQTTDATSADIATYNAFVQEVAAASTAFPGLGAGTWRIVGSTATVDARDNTGTNPSTEAGVAVFLMDGASMIAADNTDLWNGIAVAVTINENGDPDSEDRVFTGTLGNGTKVTGTGDQPLGSFGEGLGNIRTGASGSAGGGWMTNYNIPHDTQHKVFAMSDPLAVVAAAAAPVITSITPVGSGVFELTLLGDPLTGYEFRSSPTLEFDPGTLVENLAPGVPAVGEIGGTNDKLLTTDASGAGAARMALAGLANFVVARIPPPVTVLAENFDVGLTPPALPTGWTTGFDASDTLMNTVWTLGSPSGVGPSAANSSPNCVGTNLNANYGTESNTWLRTPPINLGTASGATLTFRQWFDIDDFNLGDTGKVRVLDAAALPAVSVLETVQADIQGLSPTEWVEFSADLTAASLGTTVVLEFSFVSDDFGDADASGWYIDDVLVTVPGS